MDDIEQKALALLNEVAVERGYNIGAPADRRTHYLLEVVCRAIEQHEAFRQQVSDAVEAYHAATNAMNRLLAWEALKRFMVAKPDPYIEVAAEMRRIHCTTETAWCIALAEALSKHGGKIVWGEG